jgi:NAD(P)-dependent dehydrogenase (short-subunit alcohol dehydrogenase family)
MKKRARTKPGRRPASKPARPLDGQVAVVAGATRGAGRGIARALGEAGALVYCTGRSVRGNLSPYGRSETIDETADMIVAAGGKAVARRVDHTVETEVEALFRDIDREHGRLDVLVIGIAGEEPMAGQWASFWKVDLRNADAILRQCLVSHIITAKHGAPLMMARRRGLLVEVTEGDMLTAGGNPLTQAVKVSQKGLVLSWAAELKAHGVAAIAITPGFLRSESMLEAKRVTEANWREGGKTDKNFLESETPLFVGRAVAALAADPDVLKRTGQLYGSWELGRHYRLEDTDGRRPDWGTWKIDFSRHPESLLAYFRDGCQIQAEWVSALSKRTKRFMAQLPKTAAPRRRRVQR